MRDSSASHCKYDAFRGCAIAPNEYVACTAHGFVSSFGAAAPPARGGSYCGGCDTPRQAFSGSAAFWPSAAWGDCRPQQPMFPRSFNRYRVPTGNFDTRA